MSDPGISNEEFYDVTQRAGEKAIEAAVNVIADVMPKAVQPAALVRVAFDMLHGAAAAYGRDRGPNGIPTLGSPETIKVFRAICEAWSFMPDAQRMEDEFSRRVGEILGHNMERIG